MGSVKADMLTIISTCVTSLVAIGGLWLNISKNNREAKKQRQDNYQKQLNIYNQVDTLLKEIQVIHDKVDAQEEMMRVTKDVVNSHFRMVLFNSIKKALKRGYTTVSEAIEINKLYMIYKNNGGNGEIKLLFIKYDKLKMEDDEFD